VYREVMECDSERFWSKVHIPFSDDGCWEWIGCRQGGRYGNVSVAGKMVPAHRVAWVFANAKPIPTGMHVLHACDVTSCVRPDNLFLGTHAENMADKVAKGRQARNRGEDHPAAVLNESAVLFIRESKSRRTMSTGALVMLFGVSRTTIKDIAAGRSWSHIGTKEESKCADY